MFNKDIGPEVTAFAHALEEETGCTVYFKRKDLGAGGTGISGGLTVSARVTCTNNPKKATIHYDLKKQDRKNIQVMLAHELGHAYLWFRDGFYLMYWKASITDRSKVLGQNCLDLVMDVAVDRLIRGAGFHPWTPDLIERMEQSINTRVKGEFIVSNSWEAIYEILNRRLAREFMTIDEEQIPLFDTYFQASQSVFDSNIIEGVEKRLRIIREHNIFESEGNKSAVEALLDEFGIRRLFWFCKIDEDPTQGLK